MTGPGIVDQAGPQPEYNPIYERLVDGNSDQHNELIGIVAYALYKRAKREWTLDLKKRTGSNPTESQLADYITSWTPSRLEGLQTEAAGILAAFADYVVQEQEPRILKDAVKGQFWRGVGTSMTANFFYTIVLVLAALLLAYTQPDFLGIIGDIARG